MYFSILIQSNTPHLQGSGSWWHGASIWKIRSVGDNRRSFPQTVSLQHNIRKYKGYTMFSIIHQNRRGKRRLRHHICIKHTPAQDPPVKPNQLSQETIRTVSLTSSSPKLEPSIPHGLSTTSLLPVAYCSLYCSKFPKDTKQSHIALQCKLHYSFSLKRLVCVLLPHAATIYSLYLSYCSSKQGRTRFEGSPEFSPKDSPVAMSLSQTASCTQECHGREEAAEA